MTPGSREMASSNLVCDGGSIGTPDSSPIKRISERIL